MSPLWPSHKGLAYLMPGPALTLTHSATASGLLFWLLNTGAPAHLRAFARPRSSAWNSSPGGGWLALTQEGQFVCCFHQEASLDPPPFKVGPFLYQPAFSFFLPAFSS